MTLSLQVAGINRVVHCHGSFATATCLQCQRTVSIEEIRKEVFAEVICLILYVHMILLLSFLCNVTTTLPRNKVTSNMFDYSKCLIVGSVGNQTISSNLILSFLTSNYLILSMNKFKRILTVVICCLLLVRLCEVTVHQCNTCSHPCLQS